MHIVQEYLTALFGWHVMQRQSYIEIQPAMKNYDEFKGRAFKLEFDAASNSFIYVLLNSDKPKKSGLTILFKPKAKSPDIVNQRVKTRKFA